MNTYDEQRLDTNEGTISMLCRPSESSAESLLVQVVVGTDAYLLSGSLVPSADVMKAFGANSAIVIRDPVGFAQAVGRVVPGFQCGFDGPCSYQSRRFVYGDLSSLNAPPEAYQVFDSDPSDPRYEGGMGSLTATVAQRDAYFLKHHDYIHQNEWRFIWIVDGVRDEVLFVEAPEARSFCEPWSNSTQFVAFDKNGRLPPHDDA